MSAYLVSPRLTDYDTAVLIPPFVLLGQMLLRESRLGMGIAATVMLEIADAAERQWTEAQGVGKPDSGS